MTGRARTYDLIIDNNPTTFCCCWTHLIVMMEHYATLLSASGQILTDKVGLGWVTSDPSANPRWKCSYEDWKAIGGSFELETRQLNDFVYALTPKSRSDALRVRNPSHFPAKVEGHGSC